MILENKCCKHLTYSCDNVSPLSTVWQLSVSLQLLNKGMKEKHFQASQKISTSPRRRTDVWSWLKRDKDSIDTCTENYIEMFSLQNNNPYLTSVLLTSSIHPHPHFCSWCYRQLSKLILQTAVKVNVPDSCKGKEGWSWRNPFAVFSFTIVLFCSSSHIYFRFPS